MIGGRVERLQAFVGVTFRLAHQPNVAIDFVVDTGFAGALTLPLDAVAALGLPFLQEIVANLADDTNIRADVHTATIMWHGIERDVAILAMGNRPLLGTALLDGCHIEADFSEGGRIVIEEL